jgi:CRP-like cAMP-binding protein
MLHSFELVRPFQVVNSHWETGSENSEKTTHRATPLNSEEPTSQSGIAALPVVTYQVGETVIAYGSRTARLLILKKGAVAIIKEDTEIAKVTEPGAVFGELSILLDQPNKVDVRALESSQFHVADATVLLALSPIAAHVAMVLARQVDNANDLQMNRTLPWIS